MLRSTRNQIEYAFWRLVRWQILRRLLDIKDNHREKAYRQIKLQKSTKAYKKYKYGHLGCWYNKSAFYKRFLNRNKIFKKVK